ncbi:MAG: S26 family signal peptidase [Halobacteria archaeon]|nr:S26 family signal peptidase [Halobacteria archaeon]
MVDLDDVWSRVQEIRDNPTVVFVEDLLISLLIVGGIATVLFGISGIWPPMVAVESGSMEPHLSRGDLVFVVNETNFVPDGVDAHHGVVTYQQGKEIGYKKFGRYGDVIVYQPNGNPRRPPIIHRAMRWVEEGEKWSADNKTHVAQTSGFLTKGDNNDNYDQEGGEQISAIVKPEWVKAKAVYAVPQIGKIRLLFPFSLSSELEEVREFPYPSSS